jgi:hypothetical protein
LHPSDFENHDFRMTFGTTRPLTVLRDAPEISPGIFPRGLCSEAKLTLCSSHGKPS